MRRRGRPRSWIRGATSTSTSRRRRAAGLRISHVIETHLHNDYVSGGRDLAALTGATHVIGAGAELAHEHRPVRDGDAFEVGIDPLPGARHARAHARARQLRGVGHVACRRAVPAADRRLAAGRGGRADRPARRGTRPAVRGGHVPLAPRRPPPPRGLGDGLPDPRRRVAVLDRDLVDLVVDDRLRAPPRPAAAPDGGRRVRPRAAGRPADLPALLRPDAADQPGRARRCSAGSSRRSRRCPATGWRAPSVATR